MAGRGRMALYLGLFLVSMNYACRPYLYGRCDRKQWLCYEHHELPATVSIYDDLPARPARLEAAVAALEADAGGGA